MWKITSFPKKTLFKRTKKGMGKERGRVGEWETIHIQGDKV